MFEMGICLKAHEERRPRTATMRGMAAAGAHEFDSWHQALQDELLAQTRALRRFGPDLGRPWVDTLNGSRYSNMKELRFSWRGAPWRVAFAFDPQRQAILLVGGVKSGINQQRFYGRLIRTADARYERHLESLRKEAEHGHGIA